MATESSQLQKSSQPVAGQLESDLLIEKGVTRDAAESVAYDLAHDLMSPYCPGRTVATCPSPQARVLEQYMVNQALAGKSREDIETELVARFPDIRGYGARPELVYSTLAIGCLALLVIIWVVRRWLRQSRGGGKVTAPPVVQQERSAAERSRLQQALDQLEEF